ncbi:MAG: class I SAM-dependent methyltransferase [Planctomycetota bacterium]|jgi:2-polyprenyl-3-methyl-5-hydroxy-6-metoxy-1,4-benzoquinol methylase
MTNKSATNHQINKARYQLKSTLADCNLPDAAGLKLLEIGFKNGCLLQACRQEGIHATGLEVQQEFYDRLRQADPDLDLILYDGNQIPLPDASFDLIVSYQVLEHVGSLETTLGQCVRLLKPGGIMYHVFPNYQSFYEGHYNIIWSPFFNQTTGRWYLKLLRKYTPYYETLNIVKPARIRRIMAAHQETIEVLSLGKAEFNKRFTPDQIAKVSQPLLRKILLCIHVVAPLKWLMCKLMTACGIYYPITLIARKKV